MPSTPLPRDPAYERALHHMTVTLPSRTDLGTFTQQVADALPGRWSVSVEDWSHPRDQHELCGHLWDNANLSWATSEFRLPRAALLTSGDYTQLLVIDRPLHLEQFLIGALAPLGYDIEHLGDDSAPYGIAVCNQPTRAAHAIHTRLLPRYYAARQARLALPTPKPYRARPVLPVSPAGVRSAARRR